MLKRKVIIKIEFFILLFICLQSCQSKEKQVVETSTTLDLKSKLEALFDNDQFYRKRFSEEFDKNGPSSPELDCLAELMNLADSINSAELELILNKHGWPSLEIIGPKGNEAIFLVLQHSDLHIQKKYLPLLNQAYNDNQIGGQQLALIRDRMSVRENGYQIYGTQLISRGSTGKYGLRPLLDTTIVDSLRSSLGLIPLEDYVSQWNMEENWFPKSSK
uniref:DUF6624 domain-containing protein n=1 Tax=Fulvivirga sp. TaxID=1931237 RepID=UPI00404A8444